MRLTTIAMLVGITGLELGTWVWENPYVCAASGILLCWSVFYNAYTFKAKDEEEK